MADWMLLLLDCSDDVALSTYCQRHLVELIDASVDDLMRKEVRAVVPFTKCRRSRRWRY